LLIEPRDRLHVKPPVHAVGLCQLQKGAAAPFDAAALAGVLKITEILANPAPKSYSDVNSVQT